MKIINRSMPGFRLAIAAAAFMAVAASSVLVSIPVSAAPPKPKMSTPTLSCGTSSKVSIQITMTAGATGAPAGISLQWMPLADFLANGSVWPSSDSPSFCHASFSGNANDSRYTLAAGQSVTVDIGDLLFDNGTSASCVEPLVCGTTYVFRAFAHANSTYNRSDFTPNLQCSTLPCEDLQNNCTYTQGYWKTHGPIPTGNNTNVWPVTSLMLGSVNYTDLELQAIFDTPAQGNGLISLAHQLIAAKLNIANGADGSSVAATIASADAMIGGLIVPPVGAGSLATSTVSSLKTTLDNYNNGLIGPGHCQ
jgi:hypothetical protein